MCLSYWKLPKSAVCRVRILWFLIRNHFFIIFYGNGGAKKLAKCLLHIVYLPLFLPQHFRYHFRYHFRNPDFSRSGRAAAATSAEDPSHSEPKNEGISWRSGEMYDTCIEDDYKRWSPLVMFAYVCWFINVYNPNQLVPNASGLSWSYSSQGFQKPVSKRSAGSRRGDRIGIHWAGQGLNVEFPRMAIFWE